MLDAGDRLETCLYNFQFSILRPQAFQKYCFSPFISILSLSRSHWIARMTLSSLMADDSMTNSSSVQGFV